MAEPVANEALVWSTSSPAVEETLSTKLGSLEQLILCPAEWWLIIGYDALHPISKVLTMLLRCKPKPDGMDTNTVCFFLEELGNST